MSVDERDAARDEGYRYGWDEGIMCVAGAVRMVHQPRTFNGDGFGWTICVEDRQAWPCETEYALLRALGEQAERAET